MRLRGIGPEVLLLCFLVIGAAAFVLGRRSARARRVRGDTEYFAGLDHLVNDRYDRAAEVFTRLATKSHEAEIQFALGSLMRKRGEVDRAIAIHTGLAENRDPAVREQATLALGLDYMSAGLMDRAEEKLRSLLGSERYRAGGAGKAGVGLRAATRLARGAGPVARTAARKTDRKGRGCRALLLRARRSGAGRRRSRRRAHAAGRGAGPLPGRRAHPHAGGTHRGGLGRGIDARSSSTPRRSRVRAPWRRHSCRRRTRHSGRAPRSSTPGCGRSLATNRMRRSRTRVSVVSNAESAASPGIGVARAAARGIRCAVSITAAFDEIADCGAEPRHC